MLRSKVKNFLRKAKTGPGDAGHSGHAESFDEIYKRHLWGVRGGGSGPGSELSDMWPVVIRLARFIDKQEIDHIVDLSCGAMAWWPTVIALSGRDPHFTGFDISSTVISSNKAKLASHPNMEFLQADALKCEIPQCDLLVCRETINHLPRDHAATIVERMKAAPARFIALSQNRFATENPDDAEREIKVGTAYKYSEWNLSLEPFGLPDPDHEIAERNQRSLAIFRAPF